MRLKNLTAVTVCIALFASFGVAQAETYKPGEFLLLDLQKAVLSPKLLGPSARFEAYPVEARTDAKNEIDAAADKPRATVQRAVPVAKPQRHVAMRPQSPVRNRVARSRSNPLDANASDTRVQTWPCRSGGICNWQK